MRSACCDKSFYTEMLLVRQQDKKEWKIEVYFGPSIFKLGWGNSNGKPAKDIVWWRCDVYYDMMSKLYFITINYCRCRYMYVNIIIYLLESTKGSGNEMALISYNYILKTIVYQTEVLQVQTLYRQLTMKEPD